MVSAQCFALVICTGSGLVSFACGGGQKDTLAGAEGLQRWDDESVEAMPDAGQFEDGGAMVEPVEKAEASSDPMRGPREDRTQSGKPRFPAIGEQLIFTIDELIEYSRSDSSVVRLKAIADLKPIADDRARTALEERMTRDGNLQVRLAALEALVARGSTRSLPTIKQALLGASISGERDRLKNAIERLSSQR